MNSKPLKIFHLKNRFGFTTFVKHLLFLRQPFTNTVLFGKFCQQRFWGNHSQIQSSLENSANKGFGVFVCLFVLYCNLSQSQLKYITGKHLKHYYWKKTGSVWSHPPHTSKIHSPLLLNVYFTHSRNSIEGTKCPQVTIRKARYGWKHKYSLFEGNVS